MVKITVVFKDISETVFDSNDIESIDEMCVEGSKSIFIKLKDGKQIMLPMSKDDFENKLQEGSDITLEIDL